jgi:hypothetical protein
VVAAALRAMAKESVNAFSATSFVGYRRQRLRIDLRFHASDAVKEEIVRLRGVGHYLGKRPHPVVGYRLARNEDSFARGESVFTRRIALAALVKISSIRESGMSIAFAGSTAVPGVTEGAPPICPIITGARTNQTPVPSLRPSE